MLHRVDGQHASVVDLYHQDASAPVATASSVHFPHRGSDLLGK